MSRPNQGKIRIQWNSNFAYAIGLLTSDGNLSSDQRHICFSSKEIELINIFKKALQITNRPIPHARGGEKEKKYFFLSFGDKLFYQFLLDIGLMPAKSKIIQMVDVPVRFFPDFLRGVYDGDGTFYTFRDIRWPKSFGFKMSFASASKHFITWLKECLSCQYKVKGYLHKGAGVCNLEYTKGDSKTLAKTMYYQDNLLFLPRKYRTIQQALEQDKEYGLPYLQKQRKAIHPLEIMPG